MKEIITICVDVRKARRKHRQHLSGSGSHDSRPKRLRTRSSQKRAEVSSWD